MRGQNPLTAATSYSPVLSLLSDGGGQATQVIVPFMGEGLGGAAPRAVFPRRPFDPTS